MYILVADDTKKPAQANSGFWVYGGAAIPGAKVDDLTKEIASIKESAGIPAHLPLKFGAHKELKDIEATVLWEARRAGLAAVRKVGTVAFVVIMPEIMTKNVKGTETPLGMKHGLFSTYQRFLMGSQSHGIAIIDRQSSRSDLSEIESLPHHGIPIGKERIELSRINSFSVSSNEATPVITAADLIAGAFQASLSPDVSQEHRDEWLCGLLPMLWAGPSNDGGNTVWGFGVEKRPRLVGNPTSRKQCDDLRDHLDSCFKKLALTSAKV